ncbi:MAG TPA: methylmalonyl-CoA epimerase [Anaerolineaceae bacterium]|nr:methylmalonyl-CoA epimerase [Anaerolineaceae bacterium]HPK26620.1 methylmalonyl-CoA epimerase [Anaerolineaceae bacterium]
MKPIKINHVAIVVQDIDAALNFWEQTFGLELDHVEDVPSQKSKVAFLPLGESEIELVQPTTSDSGLANFLEKRGEGMHHICIEVEDIDATLAELKSKGVRLINDVPEELPGRKMAFIHPKAANGVLVELYQLTENN